MEKIQKSEREQIMEFICVCLRHWYYFVISVGVCMVLAVIYVKTATPVFHVESIVALRHDESLTGSVGGRQSSGLLSAIGLSRGSENVEDETLKMSSQGMVKQMVKALDLNKAYSQVKGWGLWKKSLYDHSPVSLSVDSAAEEAMVGVMKLKLHVDKAGRGKLKTEYMKEVHRFTFDSFPVTISHPVGDFTLSISPDYAAFKKPFNLEILFTDYDFITQIYRKLMVIDFYKKNSDLLTLSIDDPNPDNSKKLIRTMIDIYNKNWDGDKEALYESTINYMNKRLAENTLALADADREIQNFKDRYQLTDIESDVKFYYAQSAETQKELLSIATQLNYMEIVQAFIQDEGNRYGLIPFSMTTEGQAVNDYIEKYNEIMVQRNDLHKNQPQSPTLSRMEEQLDAQRKNLIVTIRKEIEGLQVAQTHVKRKDTDVSRKIGVLPTVEREYINLKREQELQQNIYIFLLEKREELGIHATSLMPKLKIISEPFVDNKLVSPRLLRTLLTALFFGGVVIPLGLIYGLPYLRTFRKKDE
jgi:uncharacterized protein involved in exopolysaccharide biosynthesis